MLATLGYPSMEAFIKDSVPASIRIGEDVVSDEAIRPYSDAEFLRRANEIAGMNDIYKTYIGMGYNQAVVPGVILRNVNFAGEREGEECGPRSAWPWLTLSFCSLVGWYRSPKTLPGTLRTLPTNPRYLRVDWSRSSTTSRWSRR